MHWTCNTCRFTWMGILASRLHIFILYRYLNVDILVKNMVLTNWTAVSSRHLGDTMRAALRYVMFFFWFFFFYLGVLGHSRLPPEGIVFFHKTQRMVLWIRNVTSASTEIGVNEIPPLCELSLSGFSIVEQCVGLEIPISQGNPLEKLEKKLHVNSRDLMTSKSDGTITPWYPLHGTVLIAFFFF